MYVIQHTGFGVFCGWHENKKPSFRYSVRLTDGVRFTTQRAALEQIAKFPPRFRKAYPTPLSAQARGPIPIKK